MSRPSHCSGVSSIDVSPLIGGTIGPTKTFGYPIRPTKTPGGLDPSTIEELIFNDVFTSERARARTGQRSLPHNMRPPLQCKHTAPERVLTTLKLVSSRAMFDGTTSASQLIARFMRCPSLPTCHQTLFISSHHTKNNPSAR